MKKKCNASTISYIKIHDITFFAFVQKFNI